MDVEDHAEHEYMTMVAEHPDWDSAPFESSFADDFGHFDSLADVFRQIGYAERVHKLKNEALMKKPRFAEVPLATIPTGWCRVGGGR